MQKTSHNIHSYSSKCARLPKLAHSGKLKDRREANCNRLFLKPSILCFGKEKICEGPECTRTYMRIPNTFLTPPKDKRRRFRKKSNEKEKKEHKEGTAHTCAITALELRKAKALIRHLSKPSILFFSKQKICKEPNCTSTYMRTLNTFLTILKDKRRQFQKKSSVRGGTFFLTSLNFKFLTQPKDKKQSFRKKSNNYLQAKLHNKKIYLTNNQILIPKPTTPTRIFIENLTKIRLNPLFIHKS